jgi:hypothetical protein
MAGNMLNVTCSCHTNHRKARPNRRFKYSRRSSKDIPEAGDASRSLIFLLPCIDMLKGDTIYCI